MEVLLLLLFTIGITVDAKKLTCTYCPFHISPKGPTNCTETCDGDVCMIVVNKYFNGTIIAGCIQLREGDNFKEGPSSCYREEHRTLCACTTKDRCNDPTSPIANFKFKDKPILEGYQFTPMIGGGGSPDDTSIDLSKVTLGTADKPNVSEVAPMDGGVSMTTPHTAELVGTRMSPDDVVVTKTVSLQISDGEVPQQQQYSTFSPREENATVIPEEKPAKKTKSGSTVFAMPMVMVVGSLTTIVAFLMHF